MNDLVTAIPVGIAAFIATNLDDLVILTLLFSQLQAGFHHWRVVAGQYLGFSVLLLASLPGFFGGLVLPKHWIGLLGLVPIAIGFSRWLNPQSDCSQEVNEQQQQSNFHFFSSIFSPQTYSVAAITIANGGDNISIYVPLFANSDWGGLLVIVAVFFLLVGVWCYTSYKLTYQTAIADFLNRYGNNLVPFVLIGLGIVIVLESQALTPLALCASCLCLMGIIKKAKPLPEIEEN
jgi:cadmium resistance transport/sequestration family protein